MLTDELREAMHDATASPPFLPDVTGALKRAGRLRRRRAVVAGSTALALLGGVAAGATVLITGRSSTSVEPSAPTFPSPGFWVGHTNESTVLVAGAHNTVVRRLAQPLQQGVASPDGSTVYGVQAPVVDPRTASTGSLPYRVVSETSRTGHAVAVLSTGTDQVTGITLSANGRVLAWSRNTPDVARSESDVVVLDLATGRRQTYVEPTSRGQLLSPALSPDGSQLAFTVNDAEHVGRDSLEIATLNGPSSLSRARAVMPAGTCQRGHLALPSWQTGVLYAVSECLVTGSSDETPATDAVAVIDPRALTSTPSVRLGRTTVLSLTAVQAADGTEFIIQTQSSQVLRQALIGRASIVPLSEFPAQPAGG